MTRLLPLLLLIACATTDPPQSADPCQGPNACCYYFCKVDPCDGCVDGRRPDVCETSRACCYYWCGLQKCKCRNGQPLDMMVPPAPDMALPDDDF